MKNRLPLTYKPKSLIEKEETKTKELAYSVVIFGQSTDMSFIEGPFKNVFDALDIVPGTNKDYAIVRHETDGHDSIIYAWNHANQLWYIQTDPDMED